MIKTYEQVVLYWGQVDLSLSGDMFFKKVERLPCLKKQFLRNVPYLHLMEEQKGLYEARMDLGWIVDGLKV